MKYYTCANTSGGFWDFTGDNVFDVENVIELKSTNKHIADGVLNCFCKGISEPFDEIIAPGSKNLRSGIILNSRKLAVVANFPGASKTVNLDEIFGNTHYLSHTAAMPKAMENAYREAKQIHDDWEKIYIANMDLSRLNLYSESVISTLAEAQSKAGKSKVYKRFFGTTTTEGPVNFIDELTLDLSTRYFIKGRPGTGKSTFLKKLSAALLEKGFDIEQYYCSFDPNSLDMVVSRELSFCVFDSTAPHEKFPERENDIILDFYEESGLSGVDEKYIDELAQIKNAYDAKIKEGNEAFKAVITMENEEYIKALAMVKETELLKACELIKNAGKAL